MSNTRELVSQRDICNHLLEVLGKLIDQVDQTSSTKKIVALCSTKLVAPLSLLNQVEIEKWALIHKNWMIALFWVLNFESKSLRDKDYPFCHPEFQFFEPLGRKIHADLLLWDDCLRFIDKFWDSQEFNNTTAIKEWDATTQERMLCSYQSIPCKVTLRESINYLNREIALLKETKNPHNPDQKPRLYNLIEVAKTIGKFNPSDNNQIKRERRNFRDNRWKLYIAAHRNWCKRLSGVDEATYRGKDFNPLLAYVEGEKLKLLVNGRQTRTIYTAPKTSSM
jgi:hypothetical protein